MQMYNFKGHFIIFFWMILVVDSKRWYSATFIEKNKTHSDTKESAVLRRKYDEDQEQKYLPLTIINHRKESNNKWDYKIKPDLTTTHYFQRNSNAVSFSKEESKFNPNRESLYLITPLKDVVSLAQTVSSEEMLNNISDTNDMISINNKITNINLLQRNRPQVNRKRCPGSGPRQKKQLNSKQTTKSKFLEVFEAVEFEHVPCTSNNGLEGICLHEYDCQATDGTSMSICADGYGVCCIIQYSCDNDSAAPVGWFTNPEFPSPSSERLSCDVTLYKASNDIKQIRLDFMNFELLPPTAGSCEHDQFIVSGQNVNNIVPILCGINSGQHAYIEIGDVEGPIHLTIQTVSAESRLFSIKVTQLTREDELAAPTGCFQYFKEPQGHLESFNYGDTTEIPINKAPSYFNNLNYAICIERAPESCSVTYANVGLQIVNYDADGLPVTPPGQAGVEIFNCPSDWLLISAVRLCGDRLNDGSVLQDFYLNAPVTDTSAGPIVIWFKSDSGYVGRGFKLQYQQNSCTATV